MASQPMQFVSRQLLPSTSIRPCLVPSASIPKACASACRSLAPSCTTQSPAARRAILKRRCALRARDGRSTQVHGERRQDHFRCDPSGSPAGRRGRRIHLDAIGPDRGPYHERSDRRDAQRGGAMRDSSSLWSVTLDTLAKDIRLEWRSKDALNSMLFFSLLVVVIFSFSFDPLAEESRHIVGGLVWVAFLFAAVVALNQTWARELRNQVLD